MFLIKTFYFIINYFNKIISPFLIIIISVILVLPNSQLHKSTLVSSDFYSKLSSVLQDNKLDNQDFKSGPWSLILAIIFDDLATPGWLQNITERNIDLTTDWLLGKKDNWVLYIPTNDIQLAVNNKIDAKTNEIISQNSNVPICDDAKLQKVKNQGYNLFESFCFPAEVANKTQSLTGFLEITPANNDSLNTLLENNKLNLKSDVTDAKDITDNNNFNYIYSVLNSFRDSYLFMRKSADLIIFFLFILLISQLLLGYLINKKFLNEFRKYAIFTTLGIFSISFLIILSSGLITYFNSFIANLFFPSLKSNQLMSLISLEIVKFVFNLLSLAIYFAGILIFIYFIFWLFKKIKIAFLAKNNDKLKFQPKIVGNNTFDGDFRNKIPNYKKDSNNTESMLQNKNISANINYNNNVNDITSVQLNNNLNQSINSEKINFSINNNNFKEQKTSYDNVNNFSPNINNINLQDTSNFNNTTNNDLNNPSSDNYYSNYLNKQNEQNSFNQN